MPFLQNYGIAVNFFFKKKSYHCNTVILMLYYMRDLFVKTELWKEFHSPAGRITGVIIKKNKEYHDEVA